MKARVIRTKNGHYRVQWKTGWFWWYLTEQQHGYDGGSYSTKQTFETEKEANLAMIEMVQEHKVKNYNASQAGVVSEFTSEQLEEKFAEYMV